MNKYHNHKVVIAGIEFDSRLEANRYLYLKDLERKGKIIRLQRQVRFEVIPAQTITINRTGAKGQPLKPKVKTVELKTDYIADFVYLVWVGNTVGHCVYKKVIEDTKGMKTPEYIIKRKLMRLQGNPITEVSHPTQLITTDRRDFINIPYEEEQK